MKPPAAWGVELSQETRTYPHAPSRHPSALSQPFRRPHPPPFPDRLYRFIPRLLPIFAVWFRCLARRPAFSPSRPVGDAAPSAASTETTEMCPAARELLSRDGAGIPELCAAARRFAPAPPAPQLRSCVFSAAQLTMAGASVYFCAIAHISAEIPVRPRMNPRAAGRLPDGVPVQRGAGSAGDGAPFWTRRCAQAPERFRLPTKDAKRQTFFRNR